MPGAGAREGAQARAEAPVGQEGAALRGSPGETPPHNPAHGRRGGPPRPGAPGPSVTSNRRASDHAGV